MIFPENCFAEVKPSFSFAPTLFGDVKCKQFKAIAGSERSSWWD